MKNIGFSLFFPTMACLMSTYSKHGRNVVPWQPSCSVGCVPVDTCSSASPVFMPQVLPGWIRGFVSVFFRVNCNDRGIKASKVGYFESRLITYIIWYGYHRHGIFWYDSFIICPWLLYAVVSFLCHEVMALTIHGDKDQEGAETENIQTCISFGHIATNPPRSLQMVV